MFTMESPCLKNCYQHQSNQDQFHYTNTVFYHVYSILLIRQTDSYMWQQYSLKNCLKNLTHVGLLISIQGEMKARPTQTASHTST